MELRSQSARDYLLATAAPPQALRGVIRRASVLDAIDTAVRSGRVTAVSAPSGYGKSVAVSDWARSATIPVAWLSLSRFDADPLRLLSAVIRAVQSAAGSSADPAYLELLAIDPASTDIAASYEALCLALVALEAPIALVIDDLHRAGELVNEGIVGTLVDQAPATLRLVLVSREQVHIPLQRLELRGEATVLGAADLRFDATDVAAAARALGAELGLDEAAAIGEATDGWPAAVRLTVLSASGSTPGAALTDFVDEEILSTLPERLREFVLAATVLPELTVATAVALTGDANAAVLLEECVSRGLFLDRFGDAEGVPVYRWHSIFAGECRTVLTRRDPDRVVELRERAARALASSDPLVAIDQALRGKMGQLAFDILRESWVGIVTGTEGTAVLERICAVMPAPWNSDPQVLLIRACCIDLLGNRAEAQRMLEAAMRRIHAGDVAARVGNVAALLLIDDHAALAAAADKVHRDLSADEALGASRLGTLLVLGITEVRLRRPALAVPTLESAEREAVAMGQPAAARRAAGQLAFALAFGGDFPGAEAVLARIRDLTRAADGWDSYVGGAEDAASGWIAYWRADFDVAARHFRRILESGVGPTSFAGIARMYLAFIAAATGDGVARSEATELLRGLPLEDTHGVPWPAYRLVSLAALAAADGRLDRAATIARRFEHVAHIPAAGVVVADILRKAGDDRATALIEQMRSATAPFIRVTVGVMSALIYRSRGNSNAAHELLEQALERAAPLGIQRPFFDDDPALRGLMLEHAAWGTRFESFLASAARSSKVDGGDALSERERQILGYLRTTMTATEIADALGVSINTIKTHLRGIYRKLGVASRREAVRVRN